MEVENGLFVLGCYLHIRNNKTNRRGRWRKKKKNWSVEHIRQEFCFAFFSYRCLCRSLHFSFSAPHFVLINIDAIFSAYGNRRGVIVWLLLVRFWCVYVTEFFGNNRWVCSIRKGFSSIFIDDAWCLLYYTHTNRFGLAWLGLNANIARRVNCGTRHILVIA